MINYHNCVIPAKADIQMPVLQMIGNSPRKWDSIKVLSVNETTSHSTGETTSHPTKQPQDGCQVVGYKLAKKRQQSRWLFAEFFYDWIPAFAGMTA